MRRTKCGAKDCDCDNHCGVVGCYCSHTSCDYGWINIGETTSPCGNCRPQIYKDWERALEAGITFSKYRQRARTGGTN